VLHDDSPDERAARCTTIARANGTVAVHELPGDLEVGDRRIEATSDLAHDFPLPPAPAAGLDRTVARFTDPHTGDRTYGTNGTTPPAYVPEGRPFRISAGPFTNARALHLCNAPFARPSSPEHFLSTDSGCEGREMVGLLGYIGATRDGRTPRALLRCRRTVESPLLTNTRHLVTTDVRECNGASIEAVLGFVG
jgi:hypothetical protein